MEFIGIILFMNLCIFGYFIYNFIQYRKREKYRTQELNYKVQCLLNQVYNDYAEPEEQIQEPVTNIFREHVIEEISKHRLVYDEKTGRYIRLRQID